MWEWRSSTPPTPPWHWQLLRLTGRLRPGPLPRRVLPATVPVTVPWHWPQDSELASGSAAARTGTRCCRRINCFRLGGQWRGLGGRGRRRNTGSSSGCFRTGQAQAAKSRPWPLRRAAAAKPASCVVFNGALCFPASDSESTGTWNGYGRALVGRLGLHSLLAVTVAGSDGLFHLFHAVRKSGV